MMNWGPGMQTVKNKGLLGLCAYWIRSLVSCITYYSRFSDNFGRFAPWCNKYAPKGETTLADEHTMVFVVIVGIIIVIITNEGGDASGSIGLVSRASIRKKAAPSSRPIWAPLGRT